jgi:hypothetical protein
MIKTTGFRWLAGPALMATLGGGCGPVTGVLPCDDALSAKAEVLTDAVTDLVQVSNDMKASLVAACSAIAKDLGETPMDASGAEVPDDVVKQNCDLATTAIKAKVAASGAIIVLIEGGRCEVDAKAQFDCEAKCDVEGKCTPPTVELRCDPGELSGQCDAECKASATCEGTASVVAQCDGKCAGRCAGMCDGNASTGACPGRCAGTCTGDCTLDASASISCGVDVRCRGGCSVAYKAPTCEGELKPPSCMLDADCEAGCKGQGSLQATCTPPTVVVTGDATLQTTLQANLPAVIKVAAQAGLVAKAATDVAGAAENVGTAISDSATCTVKYGVAFATAVTDAVAATASISITVTASVSVNSAVIAGPM